MTRRISQLGFALGTLLLCVLPALSNGPVEAAQEKFEAGRYQEAIQLLQPALRQTPQDARLHFWLARSYFELRDWDAAIRFAEQAVRLDARNSEYHFRLGQAYGEKADAERSPSYARKTRREFEEAVRLDPRSLDARRALADFHCQASWIVGGSKDEARRQIEALAAQDPLAGILARASCYWRGDEKWDQAAAEYRRVFELKPKDAEAYFEAADFYRKRRDVTGLKAATDAAAQIDPNDARLLYYRGVMHAVAGDRLDEAERLLQAYLKTPSRSDNPAHASAHEWLGKVYERMGKCSEARASYQRALQLDGNLKDAKENLKRLKC